MEGRRRIGEAGRVCGHTPAWRTFRPVARSLQTTRVDRLSAGRFVLANPRAGQGRAAHREPGAGGRRRGNPQREPLFVSRRTARPRGSRAVKAASSSPSSPREERVGRGPRRGETNKTHLLSPALLLPQMEEREKSRSLRQPWRAVAPPNRRFIFAAGCGKLAADGIEEAGAGLP